MQAKNLRRGNTFMHEGKIQIVLECSQSKKARGSAITKLKIKSVPEGVIKIITFTGDASVEQVILEKVKFTYLYDDGDSLHFMNNDNYEQIAIQASELEWEKKFLTENSICEVSLHNNVFVTLNLPEKVKLKVTSAPEATKGDSLNNPQKDIVLETGLEIKAPLFIKPNETVWVNTETGKYDGRAQ